MTTKAEKREKLKTNRSKMTVSNRSIFNIQRIKQKKYEKLKKSNKMGLPKDY